MKPDWKDAPEWAQWLAMDANGQWAWHENRPLIRGTIKPATEYWTSKGGKQYLATGWIFSLERRP